MIYVFNTHLFVRIKQASKSLQGFPREKIKNKILEEQL